MSEVEVGKGRKANKEKKLGNQKAKSIKRFSAAFCHPFHSM